MFKHLKRIADALEAQAATPVQQNTYQSHDAGARDLERALSDARMKLANTQDALEKALVERNAVRGERNAAWDELATRREAEARRVIRERQTPEDREGTTGRAMLLEASILRMADVLYPTTNVKEAWRMLNAVQRVLNDVIRELGLDRQNGEPGA